VGRRDDGPLLRGRVERVADAQGLGPLDELLDERRVERLLDEDARAAQAYLALVVKADRRQPARACSRSASAKTSDGFLPPISRAVFLYSGAAMPAIRAPVAEPPVNAMVDMRGWATMASPVEPDPWTMFSTPAGNPTS